MPSLVVPALSGCVLGVIAGNLLAVPLLGQTAQVYGVGALAVAAWVDVAVPLAMLGLSGAVAVLLALRAGRMSAVAAIATGRAPRDWAWPRPWLCHRLEQRDHLGLAAQPVLPGDQPEGLACPV